MALEDADSASSSRRSPDRPIHRADASNVASAGTLDAIVCQHLSVARIAEALAVSRDTANAAVLATRRKVSQHVTEDLRPWASCKTVSLGWVASCFLAIPLRWLAGSGSQKAVDVEAVLCDSPGGNSLLRGGEKWPIPGEEDERLNTRFEPLVLPQRRESI